MFFEVEWGVEGDGEKQGLKKILWPSFAINQIPHEWGCLASLLPSCSRARLLCLDFSFSARRSFHTKTSSSKQYYLYLLSLHFLQLWKSRMKSSDRWPWICCHRVLFKVTTPFHYVLFVWVLISLFVHFPSEDLHSRCSVQCYPKEFNKVANTPFFFSLCLPQMSLSSDNLWQPAPADLRQPERRGYYRMPQVVATNLPHICQQGPTRCRRHLGDLLCLSLTFTFFSSLTAAPRNFLRPRSILHVLFVLTAFLLLIAYSLTSPAQNRLDSRQPLTTNAEELEQLRIELDNSATFVQETLLLASQQNLTPANTKPEDKLREIQQKVDDLTEKLKITTHDTELEQRVNDLEKMLSQLKEHKAMATMVGARRLRRRQRRWRKGRRKRTPRRNRVQELRDWCCCEKIARKNKKRTLNKNDDMNKNKN